MVAANDGRCGNTAYPLGLLAVFMLAITLFFGCSVNMNNIPERERGPYGFVMRELARYDGGMYTYPDYDPEQTEFSRTKDGRILAETVGLSMLYFVKRDRPKRFAKAWSFVRKRLLSDYGLISWNYDPDKKVSASSSASIDDLRVIRSLLLAAKRWDRPEYRWQALSLGNSVMIYEVRKNALMDGASWDRYGVTTSTVVDLSYLDLYTMSILAHHDSRWQPVFNRCMELVLKSLTDHGLFHDKWDLVENRYFDLENNLINKLMCAVHLAQTNMLSDRVIGFIERQFEQSGLLYGRYDPHSGEATVSFDSVAVYALALNFAILYDREPLIARLLSILGNFRKPNEQKVLGGCYGAANCHSFDNLQLLLAFSELPEAYH